MKYRFLLLIPVLAASGLAQLTTDQRLVDFRHLSELYARRYAALDWKKEALKVDALNLAPWLDRIPNVKDDLEFYELMAEYVASLNDGHDTYLLPSSFSASLGFTVDLYEGKPLIDSINRTLLPADQFPFEVGDEVVSVDGRTSEDLIASFLKYSVIGNDRGNRRLAAGRIARRSQYLIPRAHEIGDSAAVLIQRQGGATESYTIPWNKTGTPVTVLGASPGGRIAAAATAKAEARPRAVRYRQGLLDKLQHYAIPVRSDVIGFGRLEPVFQLPEVFVQRLGKSEFDSYYSGTFEWDGVKIGFIRIPDFEYRSTRDFEKEMTFFQDNTDVLVIDIMRNPGGYVCSSGAEGLMNRIVAGDYQGAAAEERVTWSDYLGVKDELDDAIASGDDQETIDDLTMRRDEYEKAFRDNKGRTKALPVCGTTVTRTGKSTAYTKPVLLLTDELTASAGDLFAALIQDNGRGRILGWRTAGAGGSPETDYPVGAYTEGTTSITYTLAVRSKPVVTPDFPTTSYLENVGVRPDNEVDFMTKENLLSKGAAFVKAFTDEAVSMAKGQ